MIHSDRKTPTISPLALVEGRLQLHYGIQCMATIGAALGEPLPDGSQSSFTWNPTLEVFMGAPIRAATPFRVILNPIALSAGLMNAQNRIFALQPLHGKTLAEVLEWHKGELTKLMVETSTIELLHYPPDFPDHPLAHGDRFDAYQYITARWELALYYANTFELLQEITSAATEASPIRTWPHHFDMATLIDVPYQTPCTPKSIGIGLSPGDSSYSEPYWYVSPYPYPESEELPSLDGEGFWHTQDWTGAVLPASRLQKDSYGARQAQVRAFLRSAWAASQMLLQEDTP